MSIDLVKKRLNWYLATLNDLLLVTNKIDVFNFANDTTPFVCHKNLAELLETLGRNPEWAIHWLKTII